MTTYTVDYFKGTIREAAVQASAIFQQFGFTWHDGDRRHIPTYEEIVKMLETMVEDIISTTPIRKEDYSICECGRLAVRMLGDGEDKHLKISFQLAINLLF